MTGTIVRNCYNFVETIEKFFSKKPINNCAKLNVEKIKIWLKQSITVEMLKTEETSTTKKNLSTAD